MAKYLYVAAMETAPRLEADFNRIYDTQHVPEILKVPGVKSCTRFRLLHSRVEGMPRYMATYEVESPDLPDSETWKKASDTGDWKPQIRPHTINRRHAMYEKIFESKAKKPSKYLFVAAMDIPPKLEADFNRIYDTQHIPEILKVPGVNICTRYRLLHSKVQGTPRYMAVYGLDAPDLPDGPAFKKASDTGDWKPQIRPHTTNRQHAAYEKIFEARAKK